MGLEVCWNKDELELEGVKGKVTLGMRLEVRSSWG